MIKNLILSGGGLNIYITLGALDVLLQKGHLDNLENICGCSAGSLIAVCLALGVTPRQISDIPQTSNFIQWNAYNDVMALGSPLDIGPIREMCRSLLKQYPNVKTFQDITDLYGKNVTVVATDYLTGETVYFNTENTPDYDLVECMVASCTLPFVFSPTEYMGRKYWDGTVSDPLSLSLYSEMHTLAINLTFDIANASNPFMRFLNIVFKKIRELNHIDKYNIVQISVPPDANPEGMLSSDIGKKFSLFCYGQSGCLEQISAIVRKMKSQERHYGSGDED
uniref:PNPLA domain-containing protein n=1 Tax=viral metagenome TaxID=1070528 RepID=A0A6C0KCV8_9ZZZZ